MDIYVQVLGMGDKTTLTMSQQKMFLQTSIINMWNNDTQPYVPHVVFMWLIPQVAREQAASKMLEIAPYFGTSNSPTQTLRLQKKTQQFLSIMSNAELDTIVQRLPHIVTPTKKKS